MPRAIYQSLRISQWVKNGAVLAPLIFSGRLEEPWALGRALLALACFCLASSGTYVMNDICDRQADRFHPMKRRRPVAAGQLPLVVAVACSAALVGASLAGSMALGPALGIVMVSYLVLNIAYSMLLKWIVIVDALVVAVGFVLRVWGGAVVLNLVPSHWLQLTVFFVALFLGLAKRRQELSALTEASRHREVLSAYTQPLIDQMMSMVTTAALVCYALYTVSPEATQRVGRFGLMWTIPLVVYGLFRYLYLIHVREESFSPTDALLADRPLLGVAVLWVGAVLLILYR